MDWYLQVSNFVFRYQLLILAVASPAGIVFVSVAFLKWSQSCGETSKWRKALGFASALLVALGYAALYLPPLFGSRDFDWVLIPVWAIPFSIGLSFAMRSPARPFVLLANLMMIVTLFASITI